jgi:rare lipoprotein A
VRFRPRRALSARVRLRAGASRARLGRLNVYRHARVSWYGPGLYGNPLGCGGRLTTRTLGVAHKTLPCGTRVTLRYRGRTVRVPVVDRGPYVAGREFDLTAATRRRLRFEGVHTIMVTR